jgi:type IV pilus biogenesis protein CpaD/CtpE
MKIALLVITAIALAACASPPPVVQTGPDPADPAAPVAHTRYTPVTAGTTDYRPVEPGSWRDMNERVAPRRMP